MRKRDLNELRKILEERLVSLYRSAHVTVRVGMDRHLFDQDEPRDEADEAQRVLLRDTQTTLGERDAALAQQIEAALQRMTRGEYGRCIECDGPIEMARLHAVPWAVRCVADQEAQEFQGTDRTPSL
jgi:DnaK suppressor protein